MCDVAATPPPRAQPAQGRAACHSPHKAHAVCVGRKALKFTTAASSRRGVSTGDGRGRVCVVFNIDGRLFPRASVRRGGRRVCSLCPVTTRGDRRRGSVWLCVCKGGDAPPPFSFPPKQTGRGGGRKRPPRCVAVCLEGKHNTQRCGGNGLLIREGRRREWEWKATRGGEEGRRAHTHKTAQVEKRRQKKGGSGYAQPHDGGGWARLFGGWSKEEGKPNVTRLDVLQRG